MKNEAIPLTRAGLLIPFLTYLDHLGVPIEKRLAAHGLPVNAIQQPEALVATRTQLAFVGSIARAEGIVDLGWRIAQAAETKPLGPALMRPLLATPTLYEALKVVCAQARSESSGVEVWLEEASESVYLCHRGTLKPGTLGQDAMTQWRTRTLISIIRLFAGPRWMPGECLFALSDGLSAHMEEELPRTRFLIAPDYGRLEIARELLPRPLCADIPLPTSLPGSAPEDVQRNFIDSLQQLLIPYLATGIPSLVEAAAMAGLQSRSFQRRLERAGWNYTDVIRAARFEVAKHGLEDPGKHIIDVALEVGFEDPSHFSRFFRSMAGVTPRSFRRHKLESDA